ncbi:MAG TPA: 4-hydroxy-tetrahydrodipicolinate reductase [Candidatus Kapabacteria bacterium]|nr:4-hydroxy-tetrahydrodipicolinate reductase [Candidatus Kapabacteria bacterium]
MELPKIAINGYGKMGKEVEYLARQSNFQITDIFDIDKPINPNRNYEFDVAIEFTTPNAVLHNIELLAAMGKNIVVGTTGWYDKADEVQAIVEKYNIGLVWGSNFSVGMNVFFKVTEYTAKLFNKLNNYDPFVYEIHHNQKKDSPGGTALSLAEILIENIDRKTKINTSNENIQPDELSVASSRGGYIPGTHILNFDSVADTIQFSHIARNRSGFASGALEAAKQIHKLKGYHNFSTLLNNLFNEV